MFRKTRFELDFSSNADVLVGILLAVVILAITLV